MKTKSKFRKDKVPDTIYVKPKTYKNNMIYAHGRICVMKI